MNNNIVQLGDVTNNGTYYFEKQYGISNKELLDDKHDLELLLTSAKYHDVGRKLESREEHALPSALIAEEHLKDKISNEDISVIKTIIEFHEVPRDHPSIEVIFRKIAMKNNIQEDELPRVRKMAEISKQIAEKYNFDFVPLQNRFDELSADGNTVCWSVDGIHPTSAGHQVIKENLAKTLGKLTDIQ